MIKRIFSAAVLLALSSTLCLIGCNGTAAEKFKKEQQREGRLLAVKNCASCHQFPQPELLDKKTWTNSVLPKMSGYFGLRHFDQATYFGDDKAGAMKLEDWNKIVRYYLTQSADSLTDSVGPPTLKMPLPGFSVNQISFGLTNPSTTFAGIFPSSKEKLVFGDGFSGRVYISSTDTQVRDSIRAGIGVSNVTIDSSGISILSMGVMRPSDEKTGQLIHFDALSKKYRVMLDSLQRPVYSQFAHLNNDRLTDILICEFGNNSGQLSWFENRGGGEYTGHILRKSPGATRTAVTDLNRDGRPDVIALFAQGDEGMMVYYNQGNGLFTEHRILQFSPSHGSNYFELNDLNKDGFPDILATNGDNGDYPPILKPYHGITIYLNDQKNNFKKTVFLPLNGAIKAMGSDFDGDGDMDIASIAYFPDYTNRPGESFIYWQNNGNFSFTPYSFDQSVSGRWLTMDAGDLDEDGDIDIVLGNAILPLGLVPRTLMQKWAGGSPSLLILKNTNN